MRLLTLALVLIGWVLPASAAKTFKVPLAVVPGSVTFEPLGLPSPPPPIPVIFPVSEQVSVPSCGGSTVTVQAGVVHGGIELGVDGFATAGCSVGGVIVFEGEIQVPELGGTTTAAVLVPQAMSSNFVTLYQLEAQFGSHVNSATTSSIPDVRFGETVNSLITWSGNSEVTNFYPEVKPLHWIPGNTLRFRGS